MAEKISIKLGVNLYKRAKIQTFNTGCPLCDKDLNFNPAV